jgi:hypothetical protein
VHSFPVACFLFKTEYGIAEQLEADIVSARETLENASAGVDKMRKELKSLMDKVAKSEVRHACTHPSDHYSPAYW